MPTTTVVNTIGAISIFTSLMNPSPSGLIAAACSGDTTPKHDADRDRDQHLEVQVRVERPLRHARNDSGMIERMDEFVPRRSLRGGHRMTLYGWGNPRYFPDAASGRHALLRRRRPTRACSPTATGTPNHGTGPTILALHGLNGSSECALHEGHCREGVRARHERRAAQPAQLRQHRTPLGGPVPLGPDRRRAARHRGTLDASTACAPSRWPATRSAETSP